MGSFDGKVALVAGAGSGIGRASALAFSRQGAKVVVCDITSPGARETVDLIESAEGEARFIKADVADEEQVELLVDRTVDAFGRLDFAHNNAGIGAAMAPIHEASRESFDKVLAVNVVGVWLCLKYEARVMLRQGSGAIVNTASLAGPIGLPNPLPHPTPQHPATGLTPTPPLGYA